MNSEHNTHTLRRFIPPIVSMAMFMEAIDTTIINTAIPKMAQSFNVPPVDLKIALIGYLVSLAIFIPISGWVSDKFGLRKVFLSALFIFTLSSLACGFSTNLYELILWRVIQGLGGAFMMPLGRLMVLQWFEKAELVRTMNRIVMPALIGPAIGPLLGGFITQLISWHWIFWVNVPVGVVTFIFAYYCLPKNNTKIIQNADRPLDKMGFILFGVGLACFTFGLSALSEEALKAPLILSILLISVVSLVLYVWHSRTIEAPIVDNKLFAIRLFRLAILGNMVTRLGVGAVPFLLPLMLQTRLDYSPSLSGFFIATTAIGMLLAKFFSRNIIRLLGFKKILLLNTTLLGFSICLMSTISINTSITHIVFQMIVFGFLMSLQFSSMNPLIFSEVGPSLSSAATSVQSTTMQLSQSIGVALCAIILKQLSGNFADTFMATGLLTILSGAVFLCLKKNDGSNLL
jgi:EmrB/QacA subfamily drug resistance transporter